MAVYGIRLKSGEDLEDFLCDLTHQIWCALNGINQMGDPHHYPFLEGHLREFIKPRLVLCDFRFCWKPYAGFERRSSTQGLRPVTPDGLAAYLEFAGTREELAKALADWLTPRIRDILFDQHEMGRVTETIRQAAEQALSQLTQHVPLELAPVSSLSKRRAQEGVS